eukprot:TRINITY_DN74844_c0_g1_i1.p1 TRINITY_DN74844_c0_g1~~TRINITY_DN74844_c0_g1_i1.p1  ORF type:complete len:702 (+),score=73.72 TRINITY_DN74844_c0_g1_i1:141-2246(+)
MPSDSCNEPYCSQHLHQQRIVGVRHSKKHWRHEHLLVAACCMCMAVPSIGTDAHWNHKLDHGSVQGFPSYSEANAMLNGWVADYPHLLRRREIGKSYEKRPIYAYILTLVGSRERAPILKSRTRLPQVLLTSLMHAREPTSLTVVLYYLRKSIELYELGNPEAVYLLTMREVWVVPFVNPDGYLANEHLSSKSIRKNRRPTCAKPIDGGVDINRNFAYHWNAEFARCNEEYQGAKAFSEPETQALRDICNSNHFVTAMNFHAFGNMLTYPFNYARKPMLPENDQQIYTEISRMFKWAAAGPSMLTLSYTAPGEADDWMYGAKGIISMSPEVGPEDGGFWPATRHIAGINSRNFERIKYVALKSGLMLSADWSHVPLSQADAHGGIGSATNASRNILEVRLSNTGLTASVGETVLVAVAGAIAATSERTLDAPDVGASGVVVAEAIGDAHLPAAVIAAGHKERPVIVFRSRSLPRRSDSRLLRVRLARSREIDGPLTLRSCVLEVTDPLPSNPICHCPDVVNLAPATQMGKAKSTKAGEAITTLVSAGAASAASGGDRAADSEARALCATLVVRARVGFADVERGQQPVVKGFLFTSRQPMAVPRATTTQQRAQVSAGLYPKEDVLDLNGKTSFMASFSFVVCVCVLFISACVCRRRCRRTAAIQKNMFDDSNVANEDGQLAAQVPPGDEEAEALVDRLEGR